MTECAEGAVCRIVESYRSYSRRAVAYPKPEFVFTVFPRRRYRYCPVFSVARKAQCQSLSAALRNKKRKFVDLRDFVFSYVCDYISRFDPCRGSRRIFIRVDDDKSVAIVFYAEDLSSRNDFFGLEKGLADGLDGYQPAKIDADAVSLSFAFFRECRRTKRLNVGLPTLRDVAVLRHLCVGIYPCACDRDRN